MMTALTVQTAYKPQQGAVTLVIATIMMIILGLGTLFMTKVGIAEMRLTRNFTQSKTLDSTLDTAMDQLSSELRRKPLDINVPNGQLNQFAVDLNGQTTFNVLDVTGTTVVATYTATLDNNIPSWTTRNDTRFVLSVTTTLNDGSLSTRTAQQIMDFTSTLQFTPAAALYILNGGSVSGGNVTAGFGKLDIISGATVSGFTGSINSIYFTPKIGNIPAFFEFFFSDPDPNNVLLTAHKITCPAAGCKASTADIANITTDIRNGAGRYGLVWVKGDLNLNGNIAIGHVDYPVILVVEGNLTFSNTNAVVYGAVYVRAPGIFKMTGGTLFGSAMVESSVQISGGTIDLSSATGTALTNSQKTIDNTDSIGAYMKVPGTWR